MIDMSGNNKRGRPAAGHQICECGYATEHTSNFKKHKSTCPMVKEDSLVENLKQQIEKLEAIIKEKDKQMFDLAKAPKTVNNNITVDHSINTFGKENTEHITTQQIQKILADPASAVSQFIKLKHRRAPGGVNNNIRVPNKKRAIYQVVVAGEGEEKEWENKTKGEVLEQLYDENSGHLEAEADEETRVGSHFLNYQDKIRDSANGDDGGRRYKDQLDKINCIFTT